MDEDRTSSCSVRDGRFVEPCTTLREVLEGEAVGSRKGVLVWTFYNLKENQNSRKMIGVRSGDTHKNGVIFNFCPFCGVDISAPISAQSAATSLSQTIRD